MCEALGLVADEASLAYLPQELHGAAAAPAPIAPPGTMGRPAGYQLADYLQQHLGNAAAPPKCPPPPGTPLLLT